MQEPMPEPRPVASFLKTEVIPPISKLLYYESDFYNVACLASPEPCFELVEITKTIKSGHELYIELPVPEPFICYEIEEEHKILEKTAEEMCLPALKPVQKIINKRTTTDEFTVELHTFINIQSKFTRWC
jgi:hypothetical protein